MMHICVVVWSTQYEKGICRYNVGESMSEFCVYRDPVALEQSDIVMVRLCIALYYMRLVIAKWGCDTGRRRAKCQAVLWWHGCCHHMRIHLRR